MLADPVALEVYVIVKPVVHPAAQQAFCFCDGALHKWLAQSKVFTVTSLSNFVFGIHGHHWSCLKRKPLQPGTHLWTVAKSI